MFICLSCGLHFDTPKAWKESHGFDDPPYEEDDACPLCGGDYEETGKCEKCDKISAISDLEDGLCKVCQMWAVEKFKLFMNGLTVAERKYINTVYDGEPL